MENKFILDRHEYNELIMGYSTEKYEIVEEGEWISGGKWEHKETIFKDTETGQCYKICVSRSGSYYSDYYYEDDYEAVAVKPVEKVITVWEEVQ